jgi:hypothetical protein
MKFINYNYLIIFIYFIFIHSPRNGRVHNQDGGLGKGVTYISIQFRKSVIFEKYIIHNMI